MSHLLQWRTLLPGGMAALIGAVILIGRAVGLSMTVIAILVLCLLLLGLVGLAVGLLVAQKRQKRFMEGLDKQGEEDYRMASVSRRQSIRELQERWKEAIASLKRSGLGQHADPMYHLPWFVIIGEPQSGKSTAIMNSGVEFPMGESVQGTGGTKNCDWWFSNKFILLDTAGRYTFDEGQESDREEWLAFLKLIHKYRKRMPINGLILSLPVDSLMNKSPDQLRQDARKARQKIDQISQELGQHFPVFLLVMKSDLVNGFTEFFQNLPEDRLDEVLGWTNDQVALEDPTATFDKNFDRIEETIRKLRLSLLKDETRPEHLQTVYFFPEEFRRLKQRLGAYVDVVFKSNPYFPAPFLRGMFFTSGTQVGTVISSLIQAIGLKGKLRTFDAATETRTYFLKEFFSRIIVRDKDLAVLSQSRMLSEKRKRWSLFSVAGLVFALLLAACTVSFVLNLSQGSGIRSAVEDYRRFAYEQATGLNDFNENAYKLGTYVERLEASRERRFWRGWGLYRGERYLEPLKRLFRHEFYHHCLQPTVDRLLLAIHNPLQAERGHDLQDITADVVAFGRYLSSLSHALEGPGRKEFHEQTFVPRPAAAPEYGSREVAPAAAPASSVSQTPAQTLTRQDLERLVTRYWESPSPRSAQLFQINLERYLAWEERPKIRQEYEARQQALQLDTIRRAFSWESIHRHLKRQNLPPLEPTQQYRRMTRLQEAQARSVEASFSKQVWEKQVLPLLNMLRMLGEDPNLPAAFRKEVRQDILTPLVQEYARRYQDAWNEFLAYNIAPSIRADTDEAVVWALELQAMEPIHLAAENTRIEPAIGQEDALGLLEEALQAFEPLYRFKQDQTEREYRERVREIFLAWDRIVKNPDDNLRWSRAREFLFPALAPVREAEENPLRKTEQWVAELLPDREDGLAARQLRRTLLLPVVTVRASLFDQYLLFLNDRWEREIYQTYQRQFHNRFPFMPDQTFRASPHTEDADPQHVRRFFAREGGLLASFLDEHLSLFIQQTRTGIEPRPLEDFAVNLGRDFLLFLDQARRISDLLLDDRGGFRTNDIALTTRISNVVPVKDAPRSSIFVTESRLCVRCSDRHFGCLNYWDGPPVQKLWQWSLGAGESASLMVLLQERPPRGGPGRPDRIENRKQIEFRGPWCLLKLLRMGERSAGDIIRWSFQVHDTETRQLLATANIPYVIHVSRREDPFQVPFQTVRCPRRIFQP